VKKLLQKGNNSHYLTTLAEKKHLLDKLGIANLIILPFTSRLSEMTFSEFTKHYLIDKIKAKHIVVGYNHYFGKDRQGDFKYLKEISGKYGFMVEQLDPVIVEDSYVSSSVIRENIEKGNIEVANKLLDYTYFIQGNIIAGIQIGRKIGFPTANINLGDSNKLLPGDGVYAVKVILERDEYMGMLNIGTRPTIKEESAGRTIEVHIIDFGKEIYKKEVVIHFIKRIREEKKFESEEGLIKQLNYDKHEVIRLLSM
jgi:riboflavin kinase/FMN adenylyltransferase